MIELPKLAAFSFCVAVYFKLGLFSGRVVPKRNNQLLPDHIEIIQCGMK
jgi:hypothetical protein